MRTQSQFRISRLIIFRDRFLIGMVEWTKPFYARWFKRKQATWQQTRKSLKNFPLRSLGNDLGQFLENEELELMPKLEDHDVLHVLLGYDTNVIDEARMQFFLLGNGKRSLYALLAAMVATVLVPEGIRQFREAYRQGRACRKISQWQFEYLLAEPRIVLRQLIFAQDKDVGVEAPLVF